MSNEHTFIHRESNTLLFQAPLREGSNADSPSDLEAGLVGQAMSLSVVKDHWSFGLVNLERQTLGDTEYVQGRFPIDVMPGRDYQLVITELVSGFMESRSRNWAGSTVAKRLMRACEQQVLGLAENRGDLYQETQQNDELKDRELTMYQSLMEAAGEARFFSTDFLKMRGETIEMAIDSLRPALLVSVCMELSTQPDFLHLPYEVLMRHAAETALHEMAGQMLETCIHGLFQCQTEATPKTISELVEMANTVGFYEVRPRMLASYFAEQALID
jgi:hypothetical protein